MKSRRRELFFYVIGHERGQLLPGGMGTVYICATSAGSAPTVGIKNAHNLTISASILDNFTARLWCELRDATRARLHLNTASSTEAATEYDRALRSGPTARLTPRTPWRLLA